MNRDVTAIYRAIADSPSMLPIVLLEALFDSGYVRLWNGYTDLTFESNTYTGAGNLLGITQAKETSDLRANGIQAQLSGIPADSVSLVLSEACQGRPITIYLGFVNTDTDQSVAFSVTVSGGNFYIQSKVQPTVNLTALQTYKFDQSDSTNTGHNIRVSTTSDGTHGGGAQYSTGWTEVGTAGTVGAYNLWTVPSGVASTMYYYCQNHSGMGGTISVDTDRIVATPWKLFSGQMDKMELSDDGETADIGVSAESKMIALELNKVRRYTEEDQKISYPSDTGFDFIPSIQDKLVIWGRG